MNVVVPTAIPAAGSGVPWAPIVSGVPGARGGAAEDAVGVPCTTPRGRPAVPSLPRTTTTATRARLRRPAFPDTQEITT